MITHFELLYTHDCLEIDTVVPCFEGDIAIALNNIFNTSPEYVKWKDWNCPIFYSNSKSSKKGLNFDIFLNSFLFLSGWQEIRSKSRDEHDRFPYKNSLQDKYNLQNTPVVNIYFEILSEYLNKSGYTSKKKEFSGKKSQLILTHDIDQIRSGWFENIRHEWQNFNWKSPLSGFAINFCKTSRIQR